MNNNGYNNNGYDEFILKKSQLDCSNNGFEPLHLHDFLFNFQKMLTGWSIKTGRSLLAADCGLGKTCISLSWADNIIKKTNKNVIILTPLSVSHQTVNEGEKFGIEVKRSKDGNSKGKITVTNYEKLHLFDRNDYTAVVLDESSAIKHFTSKRQKHITEFMKNMRYRLLCTATAAPNDYIELGTASEALGQLGRMDMLGTFFKNDENSLHPIWWGARWRFKAHAELPFWRWVCSWTRAMRKPSDYGFEDGKFQLPELKLKETVIKCSRPLDGELFIMPAIRLEEQRAERKATIKERCECAAQKVEHDKSAVC